MPDLRNAHFVWLFPWEHIRGRVVMAHSNMSKCRMAWLYLMTAMLYLARECLHNISLLGRTINWHHHHHHHHHILSDVRYEALLGTWEPEAHLDKLLLSSGGPEYATLLRRFSGVKNELLPSAATKKTFRRANTHVNIVAVRVWTEECSGASWIGALVTAIPSSYCIANAIHFHK